MLCCNPNFSNVNVVGKYEWVKFLRLFINDPIRKVIIKPDLN